MYLNPHRSQTFGDAAEVDVLPSAQPDLIEAQHTMGEHDRVAQPRLVAQGPPPPKPFPQPSTEESGCEEDGGGGEREPEHLVRSLEE